jgi:hypothetical protein
MNPDQQEIARLDQFAWLGLRGQSTGGQNQQANRDGEQSTHEISFSVRGFAIIQSRTG